MTTISRNKKLRGRPYVRIFALFGMALLLLSIFFWRDAFAGALWRLGEPFMKLTSSVGGVSGGALAQFSSKADLAAENAQLREALVKADALLLDRNALQSENIELKKLLARPAASTTSIIGEVFLHPPGTPYDTLMIDVGLEDGVREGDLVSPGKGVIFGAITEVYKGSARATLLSSPGEERSGFLRTKTGEQISLTLLGQGGGSLKAEVPFGTAVSIGDTVTLAESATPFVGSVAYIEKTEGSSFTVLYLHLPKNLFELRFVEVLRNEAQ